MQTFLPYPDLRVSCRVLDDRRLGKQRVETFQILRALTWPEYAWKNHPAVRMWRGFVPALVSYGVENCREWTRRGYADTVLAQLLEWTGGEPPEDPPLPTWFGLRDLHLSHRSALLRKDPAWYRPVFGPDDPDDLPYLWPPVPYPRWPLRRGDRSADIATALALLGVDGPRAGQGEAVQAVRDGRDCLLVARPGHGGSYAGLLAGLATPDATLWVAPPLGPQEVDVPDVALPPARDPGPPPAADVSAADGTAGDAGEQEPERVVLARPPSGADRLAMRAEQAPPEFLFTTALPAAVPPGIGLVVVERPAELPGRLPDVRPPVLAVVPRADAAERAALTRRLGLREPVHAGGGWDPADTRLGASTAPTAIARGRLLVSVVREQGPALVVVATRDRLDRAVTALRGAGLRAEGWAAGMRGSRRAGAVGAWRSRRLAALVVLPDEPVPLGRARLGLLLGVDAPADGCAWRDLLADLRPERGRLLVGPDAPPDLRRLAGTTGCVRAALLEPYGEPVHVPCGHCDRCAP